jgi:glycogen synthase
MKKKQEKQGMKTSTKHRAAEQNNGMTAAEQLIREVAEGVVLRGSNARRNRKRHAQVVETPAPAPAAVAVQTAPVIKAPEITPEAKETPRAEPVKEAEQAKPIQEESRLILEQPPVLIETKAETKPEPKVEPKVEVKVQPPVLVQPQVIKDALETKQLPKRTRPVLAVLCYEDPSSAIGNYIIETSRALAVDSDVHVFSRKAFEIKETNVHVHVVGPENAADLISGAKEFSTKATKAYKREFGSNISGITLMGHEWSSIPALLEAPRGVTTVLSLHSLESQRADMTSELSRGIQAIEAQGLERADKVLIQEARAADAAKLLKPECETKIVFARHPFPVKDFVNTQDQGEIKGRITVGPIDPMILYIGDMNEAHGPDVLMKAIPAILKNHKQARFVFVGDGELHWPLRVHSRYLLLDYAVRMMGHVGGQQLFDLIHAADIVCVPSRTHTEEWPVLAAWAEKKPVVSTHAMAGSFMSHEKDSVLCYANENSMVWGVERLLFDEQLRTKVAEAGYQKLQETYGWGGVARQISDLMVRDN